MRTQSEATINAVINLAKDKGYSATPFETDYNTVLTSDDKSTVVNMITQSIIDGTVSMTEKSQQKFGDDDKALRRYVVGLVNDRLRKAKALNGNVKYEHKEPGKLTSSRDPQLKALNQILNLETTTEDDKPAIEKAIKQRQAELNVEKQKQVTINYDALPADLRAKLGI
jgi:hypothetical protein